MRCLRVRLGVLNDGPYLVPQRNVLRCDRAVREVAREEILQLSSVDSISRICGGRPLLFLAAAYIYGAAYKQFA